MKDIAASKSISRLPYSIGSFAVHLCRSWTTQAPLMHKENRNTGVKQVCKGGPQHPHARPGETEPGNRLASLLHFPLYLAACCWTVSDSVQLGESRLRPGTLPLWGSSRGSSQGIRGDPVYQPSSRVREESPRAMPLSPVTSSKCTVRTNAFARNVYICRCFQVCWNQHGSIVHLFHATGMREPRAPLKCSVFIPVYSAVASWFCKFLYLVQRWSRATFTLAFPCRYFWTLACLVVE